MLPQPKLSVHFKILFSLIFKEAIVILSSMYCFWRNTPTYLPNKHFCIETNIFYSDNYKSASEHLQNSTVNGAMSITINCVIITDNLQNIRFYHRSSKIMNDNAM